MCGIVGLITKFTTGFSQAEVNTFGQMIYCDAVRGFDSTGMFHVNKFGNVEWAKAKWSPINLMSQQKYRDIIAEAMKQGTILIGHNRKATVGEVNDENAHPFVEGKIILVHNGSLDDHKKVADTVVDSHALAHLFNEKDYKEAVPEISGAFALVWYNVEDKKLRCLRNSKRPLFIVETNSLFYIASEVELIHWMLTRNSYTVTKPTRIIECEAGTCYTIDPGALHHSMLTEEKLELFRPKATAPIGATSKSSAKTVSHSTGLVTNIVHYMTGKKGSKRKLAVQQVTKNDITVTVGQTIRFKMVDYENLEDRDMFYSGTIIGESEEYPGFVIKGLFEEKLWDSLGNSLYIEGEVTNINREHVGDQHLTIWLKPSSMCSINVLTSLNGQEVSKDEYQENFDIYCHECKVRVEYQEIEKCVTFIRKSKMKLYCPDCSEEIVTKSKQVMHVH